MDDLTLYNQHKADMRTGDTLGWESRSLVGAAIRWKTGGDINHSSMVIRLAECEGRQDRRFHTEALEKGVYPNLLSERLRSHTGRVWWYPLIDDWDAHRVEIAERLATMWGKGYDYGSLFWQLVGKASADTRRLFCSETCFIALGYKGIAPNPYELSQYPIWKPRVLIYDGRGD